MSDSLPIIVALFMLLLPVVVAAVARSKGRSRFNWSLLSLALTPVGALILLIMLPARNRGAAGEPDGMAAKLAMLPGTFGKIAFGDRTETAGHAELDEKLAAETREARVDRLIAERLSALKAAPVLNAAATSAAAGARPSFGKRR